VNTFQAVLTDADLYRRGTETLLASWEEDARAASGASLERLAGADVAVFPHGPERAVYNNALLWRAEAIGEVEAVYAAGGVDRFAVWVRDTEVSAARELERRGYQLDTTTRSMGMALDEIRLPRPEIDLAPAKWADALRVWELAPDFLGGGYPAAYHVLIARRGGESVAAGLSFDHEGDCGIYNVGTLPHARRQGLGTALTALLLYDALARGCETASLQSTQMAERIYARAGFRDLGRILEYVPASSSPSRQ
jgi:ribosomal protein S18 acetylase RimI-like enzyme